MQGQRIMAKLVGADRKAAVTQVTTFYSCGKERKNNISKCTTRPQPLMLMSYDRRKPHPCLPGTEIQGCSGHRLTKTGQVKTGNIAWSNESGLLLRLTEHKVIINPWTKSCLVMPVVNTRLSTDCFLCLLFKLSWNFFFFLLSWTL